MAKLIINQTMEKGRINPELYGHFSEHLGRGIYEGIYVGEDSDIPNVNGMRFDVVEALKEMSVALLRWPGGCFADEYHWKDGIGPKDTRKKMVNTHWGGVVEDNAFGTHEYFELCKQLGCKTYINGNLGSGTVQEMSEWVEYMTFDGISPMADLRVKNGHREPWRVDYFGIGNENWGCGGNMTPEYYANEYRRYQTYVREYNPGRPIQKICGGPNDDSTFWTRKVLETCFAPPQPPCSHGFMDGLSMHYYVLPGGWDNKGSATDFDREAWVTTMYKAAYMEELIHMHGTILDEFDRCKKIGLVVDEWGGWYDVEPGTNPGFLYQQNTMRDALIAGITLNIFNKHCDRVKVACIAQMVNVLQSVILTDGARMLKTPTYHVFHMFKPHQGAVLLESSLSGNASVFGEEHTVSALFESVSRAEDGSLFVSVANTDPEKAYELEIKLAEGDIEAACATVVNEECHSYNSFEEPERVTEKEFTGFELTDGRIKAKLPACSVTGFRLTVR